MWYADVRWCGRTRVMTRTAVVVVMLLSVMTAQLQSFVIECSENDSASLTSVPTGTHHLRAAVDVRCEEVKDDVDHQRDLEERQLEQDQGTRRDLVRYTTAERRQNEKDYRTLMKRLLAGASLQQRNMHWRRRRVNVLPAAGVTKRRPANTVHRSQREVQTQNAEVSKRFVEGKANMAALAAHLPSGMVGPKPQWIGNHLRIWGKRTSS